ncbi:alpha/beta hydrolase [Lentibacillus kapialis]|uniref:Alpha/beta hydrolase n=1 Tax=Lentibacillus kapialis TaxID=340214 RepID=A0A917UZM5_9BACI|nr:alpha/beta fold hydrolase [Lentibacillus kapialis]GGK03721.1 alpha/beta hydrolase [Lentibacillus kapialis]
MNKWVLTIGITLVLIPIIYLGIGFGLALLSPVDTPDPDRENLKFTDLKTASSENLPEEKTFEAKDGQQLTYRYYSSRSRQDGSDQKTILVLIHGSGYHSTYLWSLASNLADKQIADVYTPDMRGHGEHVDRRGDVDYVGQLENDLEDFLRIIKQKHPQSRIILGGHSSGGGLVIRYAGGQNKNLADGYLLLAPYVHRKAPTNAVDSGWANPDVPRIVGLQMLNNVHITFLNHLPVISFNMPGNMRDSTETLKYSYRMQYSMVPHDDYKHDLKQIHPPALLVVGSEDHSFDSKAYKSLFGKYSGADVSVVDGLSHFGIVTDKKSQSLIADWIQSLSDSMQ